jgi:hypothetical protein
MRFSGEREICGLRQSIGKIRDRIAEQNKDDPLFIEGDRGGELKPRNAISSARMISEGFAKQPSCRW